MTYFEDDDGNRLEYNGKDFGLTKEVCAFHEFKIKGDFSVHFKIINSPINRDTLGYYGPNQANNPAFGRYPFNLVKDGNKIMRGNIIIAIDHGDELECFFISGNSNWLKLFDFKANEIRTTRWGVKWTTANITARTGATEGIIFPWIDYAFKHERCGNLFMLQDLKVGFEDSVALLADQYFPDCNFPCCYLHTIIKELCNHVQVNVSGDIFSDKFFLSLIITVEGPNFTDPLTGEEVYDRNSHSPTGFSTQPAIKPETVVGPKLTGIDFIKWVCLSFGCIPYFDEDSQTLTLNRLDKFQESSAENWSDYFISYRVEYDKVREHNYITNNPSDDPDLILYNESNTIDYGELDVESEKTDESSTTVYESIFPTIKDAVGGTTKGHFPALGRLRWACPFVPFYLLEDEETQYSFTSVSNNSGYARFNGTGFPFAAQAGFVFRVICDSNQYSGYHWAQDSSSTAITSNMEFRTSTTGVFYLQKFTKQNNGPYILSCLPGVSPADVSSYPNWDLFSLGSDITSIDVAYYSKPSTPYAGINAYQQGLNYGPINLTGYNDITMQEAYLKRFSKILKSPPIEGVFVLPQSVFQDFKFQKFVYLKTEKLSGYFFVRRIENYIDSSTPVRVELIQI